MFTKGYTPWNKGKKVSQATKEKISKANTGKKRTKKQRNNISKSLIGKKTNRIPNGYTPWNKGIKTGKLSIKTRKKMSASQIKRVKDGNNKLWKGGIHPINKKIRKSIKYKLWREDVFARDNYTCVWWQTKRRPY